MMNCPICGKEMAKGTVISSGSMPFSTNITFKFELHTENVRSCLMLEKKAVAYYCVFRQRKWIGSPKITDKVSA